MSDRMVALSTAPSLFVADQAPCEIDTLVRALVGLFGTPSCPVVIDNLESCCIEQGQADAIALVLGELAVNSTKHGSMRHGGSVHVTSRCETDTITIFWVEQSKEPVKAHQRDGGQSLRIMDRIVRARGGLIAYDWEQSGLTVKLSFGR